MDDIRKEIDLSGAERAYSHALAWEPDNATALQRLAEIYLSRGQYPAALDRTETAWQAGHHDNISRLLLGDALVAAGQPGAAAEQVRGLTWAKSRLMGQAWYRYWIHADYPRAVDAWGAVLTLDPSDSDARAWQSQARKQIK